MNLPRLSRLRLPVAQIARVILSTSVIALLGYTTSKATDLFWDVNGTTAGGSGTTSATGTWGTGNSLWNTDSTGGGAGTFTDTTLNIDDLHFSAGTGVTGSSTVTVSGAQVANSLIFEEGSITLSGGTSITLGGGAGSNTGLSFVNGTGANIIGTAIILASDATFTNNDNSTQTISGGITGVANLILNANSTGTFTLSTGGINNTGTITNSGTGTGATTISGVIGSNVTGIIQNSTTSGLVLSGANSSFAGPVTIKAGTITVSNASGLGTGTVTIGDTAGGSNPASLVVSAGVTIANVVSLASNTTGTLTIGSTTSTGSTFTGGVTGNNNFTINSGSTGGITFSTGAINNAGTLTHTGTSSGTVTINSLIGSNVTQVVQNSATSQLTLTNSSNAFGSLFIKAGTVQATQSTAGTILGLGSVTLGDTAGSAAANLSMGGTASTFSNPIVLGGTTGLLTIKTANSSTGVTFSGGITGANNVTIQSGTGTAAMNITTGTINNAGTITNGTVTGTGAVTISSVIGANVTGVIENSTTSRLVLSNAELYNAPTTVTLGILELASGGSLAGSAVNAAAGTTFLVSGNSTIGTSGNGSVTITGGPTTTGGTLSLTNNGINTLTINSATPGATVLTMGDASGASQLTVEVAATSDQVVLGSGLMASIGAGGVTVNVNVIGALSGTTQTLISAPGGGLNTGGGFNLNTASGNFGGYTLALNTTATTLQLTESANATPAAAYWSGAISTAWNGFSGGNANNSNWLNGPAGTDTHAAPGATTNVFLTANAAANLATTLGQSFEINSLTFTGTGTSGTSAVSIGGSPNTLTIDATGANGNTPGVGITTLAGAGADTISAPIILGGSQSWTSNSGTTLTISGGVTGTANLTLNANSTAGITLSTNAVNNSGTITSSGTGTGTVTISALIGSNVTSVTQAGASPFTISSAFTLSATNSTLISTGSGLFTFSGGITGTQNLVLNANSTGGITLSTGSVNNAGTITNSGNGTGTATISGVLGANVTGVTENSATSALTLSGANSAFAIGVLAKLGILNVSTNNTALGTAAVALGDSTPGNSNSASLFAAGGTTLTGVANAINVVAGSSGTLSLGIGSGGPSVTFSGPVAMNNNLTLSTASSGKVLTISGGITGTGNLTTASSAGTMTISSAVNNVGTITNSGTGAGTTTFSGGIGSNVTAITQASGTNALSITTNALALNGGGTTITSTAAAATTVSGGVTGTANLTLNANSTGGITISGGASHTGDLILNANSTGVITLSTVAVNNTGTIVNSGTGTATTTISGGIGSNVTAITENSATSALTISTSAITVNSGTGTTLTNASSAKVLTLSGGTTGTGNLILKNNGSLASGITVSTGSINHTGTVTNSGTGSGSTVISSVIGLNVTGVIQNSATSVLNLTGTNTYAGSTLVSAGTLLLSGTGAIGSSSGVTINGSGADFVQTSSVAVAPTVTLTQGTLDGTTVVNTVNVANSSGTLVTAGNGGAGTLTIGTLTFGGASNVNLTANGATMSTTLATTALTSNAAGTVLINLTNNTFWSNATYNLITYGGGSIGGNGFSSFQVGTITGLGPRQGFTLNNTGSAITLTIAGDSPVWTGALDGRWTTATLSSPKNWNLITAGTPTDFITGDIVLFDDTATGTTIVNISDADVSPSSTTFNNSTKNYTLGGSFGIAAGALIKSGTGTLTINNVNSYSGATTIQNGTVVLGVDNALPTTSNLILGNNLTGGSSTEGILDMTNFSQTIASLAVQSDSATADQILIGSGKTLTINGNVTVGENNSAKTTPKLTMSGGGSLVVTNNASGAVFQVGANTTATTSSGNNATVNLSGLSTVTISLNTTNGAVNVGDNVTATANSGVASTLLLPTTGLGNTTITAASLNVGTQGRNSVLVTDHFVNMLKLGSGANVFNVNSFNVGTGTRDAGSVTFTNASGTLTLRNAAGTGRATLSVGTGASNTGANRDSTFDVTGHSVDLLIGTLTVGDGVGVGVQNNVFSMNTGVLDATTLNMGKRSDGSGLGTNSIFTTTVTLGSNSSSTETVTIGTGGITLLNQQATVASSSANAVLNSTLNILGGTITVGGDIIQVLAAGPSNHLGTLNLNGGTLDMSGKKIGGSSLANNIDSLIFASGTLKNVGEINNGAGLTKTTTGTLTLAGTNTYTGATTVKAGTLVVSGSLSGSTAVTVGDAANLATSTILGGSGTLGNVTVGAAAGDTGATLMPHAGSSSTSLGNTLNTGSVTFADGSAHLSLELGRSSAFSSGGGNGTTGGDVSDHLNTVGAVTLNGADLDLSLLTTTGYGIGNGDVLFMIINGSGGAINGTFASFNGTPTVLSEGSQFIFNSQQYTITYQANFAGNSYTGGNDVAIMAVPEPAGIVSLLGGGLLLALRRRRAQR
jgi:hypothetical protein